MIGSTPIELDHPEFDSLRARQAAMLAALLRREVDGAEKRANAYEDLAIDLRDRFEDGVRPDVIVEKFMRELELARASLASPAQEGGGA